MNYICSIERKNTKDLAMYRQSLNKHDAHITFQIKIYSLLPMSQGTLAQYKQTR